MTNADRIALAAAIIAGLSIFVAVAGVIVTKAANAINRTAGLRQIKVAERELFLSLVEKRTVWMNEYLEAFIARQNEWRHQVHLLEEDKMKEPLPWDKRLLHLSTVAGWLFDEEVMKYLGDIDRHQHKALGEYWEWIKSGNEKLEIYEVGPDAPSMTLAHESLGGLWDTWSGIYM